MTPQETPKEKAKELFAIYSRTLPDAVEIDKEVIKQCVLIAVELRLDADFEFVSIEFGEQSLEWWQLVKTEIENYDTPQR